MKHTAYFIFISIFLIGCLDTPTPSFGDPVDETDFLEEYAQREGVMQTESGLLYRIINEGDGERPDEGKVVFVEYEGRLIDDVVFMETEELDYFALTNDIIEGIFEGIQLMREGAEYEFVLPSELGYGQQPPQGTPIQNGSVLIFNMKLDSFLRDPVQFLNTNAQREDVLVTQSGLQYRVVEEGSGESPGAASNVVVRYTGSFTNGFVFDRTPGNTSTVFSVNQVIPGFSEGLQLMQEGAKYQLFIPSNIGYGDQPPGAIPAGAVLVFDVELVEIN